MDATESLPVLRAPTSSDHLLGPFRAQQALNVQDVPETDFGNMPQPAPLAPVPCDGHHTAKPTNEMIPHRQAAPDEFKADVPLPESAGCAMFVFCLLAAGAIGVYIGYKLGSGSW